LPVTYSQGHYITSSTSQMRIANWRNSRVVSGYLVSLLVQTVPQVLLCILVMYLI